MNKEFFLYHCTNCVVLFGVETALEDQSQVLCPLCMDDDFLEDGGSGAVTITRELEEES